MLLRKVISDHQIWNRVEVIRQFSKQSVEKAKVTNHHQLMELIKHSDHKGDSKLMVKQVSRGRMRENKNNGRCGPLRNRTII